MTHTVYMATNYASLALIMMALALTIGEAVRVMTLVMRERMAAGRTSVPEIPAEKMPPMPETRAPRTRRIRTVRMAYTIDLQELDLKRTAPQGGKEAQE